MSANNDCTDDRLAQLADWIIPPPSAQTATVVSAPIEIPGWEERPWVKVRPLTYEEEMRRQSIGWYEEYEVPGEGPADGPISVRQWCDQWALAEFDYRHCVVDFRLPELGPDGTVRAVEAAPHDPSRNVEVLKRLPPALREWLNATIGRVNRRRPEDARVLGETKKG